MNGIEKFIEDNELDFTGSDSGLNSNCTIISGYSLFFGILNYDELIRYMPTIPFNAEEELKRVFKFAKDNNYGNWWTDEKAHEMYKF